MPDCLTECLPLSWKAQLSSIDLPFTNDFPINPFEQLFEREGGLAINFGCFSDLEVLYLLVDAIFRSPVIPTRCKPPGTRLISSVATVLDRVFGRF